MPLRAPILRKIRATILFDWDRFPSVFQIKYKQNSIYLHLHADLMNQYIDVIKNITDFITNYKVIQR